MNIRPAREASEHFLKAQDAELQKQLQEKGIVEATQALVSSTDNRLKLWQGDITRLNVDAIHLTGCNFYPPARPAYLQAGIRRYRDSRSHLTLTLI